MCGIVGAISSSNVENVKDEAVNLALQRLSKRGPDFQGFIRTPKAVLGHARLSIIDTTSIANQPFWDESKRYCIVFNGEIFNYKELKKTLIDKNIIFKTNSDTEVLLHLLIAYGEDAISKLNGFFSFCFYDTLTNESLLVRDRFGIKPLVYTENNGVLYFASEIKALLPFLQEKVIDKESLSIFFRLNYIPAPKTIFKNIYKLNPSTYIKYSKGKIEFKHYYKFYPSTENYSGTYDSAKAKVKELLDDATQLRMISDVPLGTFLSGGIDSSIVSTIAAKHTDHLNTFSIGFKDEPYFDETHYANLVAKKIKSNHTVFSLSNNDLLEHFQDTLDYFDEPFADSSALNMFILSKETKQKVTVALSGDGADELFSGYNKHEALLRADSQSLKNSLIKNFGGGFASMLPKSRNSKIGNVGRKINKFSSGLKLNSKDRYVDWASFMDKNNVHSLVSTDLDLMSVFPYLNGEINDFNDYLFRDFQMVLEGDMLRKVDAMSMANSLEVRTPFLDYRLVDFVFSLPANFKIDSKNRKKILKDAYREELPGELYTRGKKGFEVPLKKWFQTELKSTLEKEVFNKSLIEDQGILIWKEIEAIKSKLNSKNSEDAIYNVWALLSFQNWLKKYYYN